MEIFIPTYGTITALELAQIFISHVFSEHGLPLKSSRDLSAAFHPETDGQTEKVNQIPEQYLWMYSVPSVLHVSLLEPVKQSRIPNCNQLPPPPVLVEEQEEWEVAQAMESKIKRGKLWYLVEWKGFSEDPKRTTWEPASNLTNSPGLFKDFHSLYPDKPGP
ncbi:hypothetical protein O181_090054 [Austropuccinia psidii MF-1]|uniref:Chromo domain-containing protein n=1 Tax=Austropuccinia psidii MF-1 TaxID=1389203 RepID=A0A9Q3P6H3_9BASI|nr:hypothetical protein [Austropuccinia psidii MF-1]